jgi:hypothetical protein
MTGLRFEGADFSAIPFRYLGEFDASLGQVHRAAPPLPIWLTSIMTHLRIS